VRGKGILLALGVAGAAGLAVRLNVGRRPAYPPGPLAVTAEGALGYIGTLAAKARVSRSDLAIAFAPSQAGGIEPLVHGRAYFPRMLEDIRGATSSIHFLIYGFKVGDIGTSFRDALIAKVDEGVEVRLSVDGVGSEVRMGSKQLYRELVEGGVQVVLNEGLYADLEGPLGGRRYLDRRFDDAGHFDHRKMMVVDGRAAYVGGTGIEDHFNDERFYDTMTRVEGPVVSQLQVVFLSTWLYQGGDLPRDPEGLRRYFPTLTAPADPVRTTVLVNVPGEGFFPISDATEKAIEDARHRVSIVNPYITEHSIIDRLEEAAERGVDVRIVVPGKPTPPYPAAAFRHHYERLLSAGVRISAHPDMAHAKIVRADDRALVGGCNLDALSLYHNFELNLLFEDAATAERVQTEVFDTFEKVAIPVEVPSRRGERLWNAAMDVLAPLL
jgi:cardiolipin synthase